VLRRGWPERKRALSDPHRRLQRSPPDAGSRSRGWPGGIVSAAQQEAGTGSRRVRGSTRFQIRAKACHRPNAKASILRQSGGYPTPHTRGLVPRGRHRKTRSRTTRSQRGTLRIKPSPTPCLMLTLSFGPPVCPRHCGQLDSWQPWIAHGTPQRHRPGECVCGGYSTASPHVAADPIRMGSGQIGRPAVLRAMGRSNRRTWSWAGSPCASSTSRIARPRPARHIDQCYSRHPRTAMGRTQL
jgi:hypothetical protein